MALKYSTGLKKFLQNFGSKKQALTGGVFRIYNGTVPADGDSALDGTKLVECTLASGAWTAGVRSAGSCTLTGTSGNLTNITVNSVEILGTTVPFNTSLTQTAADAVAVINKRVSSPRYEARSSGAKITIYAMPGLGTGPNGYDVTATCATGDLGSTDVNMGTEVAGVAAVNGMSYDDAPAGVLTKVGVLSGVNAASGTATYFVFTGYEADAAGASTTIHRIIGTCGTSGADYNMESTSLTSGATHTVDTLTDTL